MVIPAKAIVLFTLPPEALTPAPLRHPTGLLMIVKIALTVTLLFLLRKTD
ncbi:hypothetical protein [Serratia marcescens]|uniref:Uncharacterized protein n=1 Tax=Serratia marcescens TaxID=615 RepID=K7WEW3_SERMA|nr:hypothetical protein [Serratia marcescens]AFX60308.1 Hypothetical protein [Serratia marcescens]